MFQAVDFNEFASYCPFAYTDTEVNNGYGCDHPDCELSEYDEEFKKNVGCCFCESCPLVCTAEQEDLDDPELKANIDWDGLCEDGEVGESEIGLITIDESATEDQKKALFAYTRGLYRYDKEWLEKYQSLETWWKEKQTQ